MREENPSVQLENGEIHLAEFKNIFGNNAVEKEAGTGVCVGFPGPRNCVNTYVIDRPLKPGSPSSKRVWLGVGQPTSAWYTGQGLGKAFLFARGGLNARRP